MAEYANREAGYASNMQEQIKAFADVIIDTHEHAADREFQRTLNILQNADNEQIDMMMTILGMDQGLRYHASLPAILFMRLSGFGLDDGTYIKGHMDVHAMTSESTKVKSDTKVEGGGKIGWGPVSASVKISANVGVESDRKRESDYSAGVEWHVGFKRLDPPEGVSKIIDSLMSIQATGNEINKSMAANIAGEIAPTADQASQVTEEDAGNTQPENAE